MKETKGFQRKSRFEFTLPLSKFNFKIKRFISPINNTTEAIWNTLLCMNKIQFSTFISGQGIPTHPFPPPFHEKFRDFVCNLPVLHFLV